MSGWVTTRTLVGRSASGASVAPDLHAATLRVVDLPLDVRNDDDTLTPTGSTLDATAVVTAEGRLQRLMSVESDRGTFPGSLQLAHLERWRDARATVVLDGAALPAGTGYVGAYVGTVHARLGSARAPVGAAFLHAALPGTTRTTSEVAMAEGPFGTVAISTSVTAGHPELGAAWVDADGSSYDLTGSADLDLRLAPDLASGVATFTLPGDARRWSLAWTQAGPLLAERSFVHGPTTDSQDAYQVRSLFQQRSASVVVTVDGVTSAGSGTLMRSRTASTLGW